MFVNFLWEKVYVKVIVGSSILILNQVFIVIANYFHGIVKLFYLDILDTLPLFLHQGLSKIDVLFLVIFNANNTQVDAKRQRDSF